MRRLEGVANHLQPASCVSTVREGDVAVLVIDNPPVGALSSHVQEQLLPALEAVLRDPGVVGVVLRGKRTFVAGADIKEMGSEHRLRGAAVTETLFATLEMARKPVVAAVTGYALGGGLELAMMCSGRVTHTGAKLGLPEQSLGLIPGWGGTQRLPRLVGMAKAAEMILRGQPIGGREAAELGLVDACVDSEDAVYAAAVAAARSPLRPAVLSRPIPGDAEADAALLQMAHTRASVVPGAIHPRAAVEALQACLRHSATPREGLAAERKLIEQCALHSAHAALRHVFLAQRQCGRVPELATQKPGPVWRCIAVVGAGKMGSGIALNVLLETEEVSVLKTFVLLIFSLSLFRWKWW
jgi:3-hydroxyacyl-CoA dehydrogenase